MSIEKKEKYADKIERYKRESKKILSYNLGNIPEFKILGKNFSTGFFEGTLCELLIKMENGMPKMESFLFLNKEKNIIKGENALIELIKYLNEKSEKKDNEAKKILLEKIEENRKKIEENLLQLNEKKKEELENLSKLFNNFLSELEKIEGDNFDKVGKILFEIFKIQSKNSKQNIYSTSPLFVLEGSEVKFKFGETLKIKSKKEKHCISFLAQNLEKIFDIINNIFKKENETNNISEEIEILEEYILSEIKEGIEEKIEEQNKIENNQIENIFSTFSQEKIKKKK